MCDIIEQPNECAIRAADLIVSRAKLLGMPTRVLDSAEGGRFVTFIGARNIANIETFNSGEVLAAIHEPSVYVWDVDIADVAVVDAALLRISRSLR